MLDDDFGLRTEGGLLYVHTEAQLATLREFVEQRQADGVDIRLIDGDEARSLAPILPDTVIGASFCPLDAQMESDRYVRGFATAAERAGARILGADGRSARSSREGDRDRARRHRRRDVHAGPRRRRRRRVDAGAAASGRRRVPIHPMRLQIVQTTPMERRPRSGPVRAGARSSSTRSSASSPSFRREDWLNEAEDRHGKALLEAVCQRADGSYLLGCAMDYPGFVWEPDLAGVALVTESLPAIMPALRPARFARAWAGVLPFTTDNLPIIDAVPGLRRRRTSPPVTCSATAPARRPAGSSPTSICGGDRSWTSRRSGPTGPGLTDPVDTSVW